MHLEQAIQMLVYLERIANAMEHIADSLESLDVNGIETITVKS